MGIIDTKKLYERVRDRKNNAKRIYDEEKHCPLIFEVMNREGTLTAFLRIAEIGEDTFYRWTATYPIFRECYQIAKTISKHNWEQAGERGSQDEFFNFDYWRITGAQRYGYGRAKIRLDIDPDANPFEQYKQLIKQAGQEEFTASELKQVMEGINVGIKAFESHELQTKMDEMKSDVEKMKTNYGNDRSAIEITEEKD